MASASISAGYWLLEQRCDPAVQFADVGRIGLGFPEDDCTIRVIQGHDVVGVELVRCGVRLKCDGEGERVLEDKCPDRTEVGAVPP